MDNKVFFVPHTNWESQGSGTNLKTKEIPCLTGKGKPTAETAGAVGCWYMDTDSGTVYKCTAAADGVYTWIDLVNSDELRCIVEAYLQENPPEDGADGGHYTPVITQPTADTMKVEFLPSRAGMAAVEPVEIKLPVGSGNDSGQNVAQMEPADGDTPLVFFTGVKPTTKDNVLAEMVYISKGKIIKAYVKIKCQGSSSMNYPKKNYTVALYQDEARTIPLYLEFKDWGIKVNKFVLKADWIDHSHARNICTARIWKDIVESRPDYDTLPEELKNAPGHGAIVGFPIAVYYNGNYEGLYNWNIGKDPWMWGMDEDNPNHAMLCAETNNEGKGTATMCNFQGPIWGGIDGQGWSIEIGENSTSLKNSLNALIEFVANADEETFVGGLEEYLDVQSAMDYYCLCYADCGLDGLGKNMTIGTYDGKRWIMGAYDLDCTWLLHYHGGSFVPATYRCPEDYQENANLLFDKFERYMTERLKANYWRLRSGPLAVSNVMQHFERYIGQIGSDRYADDLTAYPNIPQAANNNIWQIRAAVRDRYAYTDAEFAAMVKPVPATGISLSQTALVLDSREPVTITATVIPTDSTDSVVWESTNPDVAMVANGVVTPLSNGSTTIRATAGAMSAECAVTVQYAVVPCTAITLSGSELTFADKTPQTLTAYPVPTNTTDAVLWESSNTNVATVEGGVVTPVGKGNCTITATCGNQSATCAVTVSIRETAPLADGVKTYDDNSFKGDITVSGGNHVRVDLAQLNTAGTFNITDINKGSAVTNQPRIFGLKQGDVVVTTITYSEVSDVTPLHAIRAEGITGNPLELVRTSAASVGTPSTKTVTVTEDIDVGALSIWMNGMWGDNSGKPVLLDFTLSMTVNGEEYIIPTE